MKRITGKRRTERRKYHRDRHTCDGRQKMREKPPPDENGS
jgi:hypothetical protein